MSFRFKIALELLGIAAYVSAPIMVTAMIGVDLFQGGEIVTVSLDGMCCQKVADSAAVELRKIHGVRSITADLCARRLFVTVQSTGNFPTSEIWATLRNCKLAPRDMVWRDQTIGASMLE